MTTVSAERLSKIFVEVADTLVDEFDLLEFLHMLTDRAQTLADASAVGLVLADQRGELQFMAASHESARLLELIQLHTNEGPCLEAYRTGSRWPSGSCGKRPAGGHASRPRPPTRASARCTRSRCGCAGR